MVLPNSYSYQLRNSQNSAPRLNAADIKNMQNAQVGGTRGTPERIRRPMLAGVGRNIIADPLGEAPDNRFDSL